MEHIADAQARQVPSAATTTSPVGDNDARV